MWGRVNEEKKFKYIETLNLNQDALENTFDAIRLHCGSNNKLSVWQFVDGLKTVISNGLAYRGLLDPNYEDDGATLLDNLYSFLKPSSVPLLSQQVMKGRQLTSVLVFFYCSLWCFVCWLLCYIKGAVSPLYYRCVHCEKMAPSEVKFPGDIILVEHWNSPYVVLTIKCVLILMMGPFLSLCRQNMKHYVHTIGKSTLY